MFVSLPGSELLKGKGKSSLFTIVSPTAPCKMPAMGEVVKYLLKGTAPDA